MTKTTEIAKVEDMLEITIGGKPVEIKMTFGLLNELARRVGDIDDVAQISYDPDLREAMLVSLLSGRDAKGKIVEELSVFNLDMTTDDVMELLDWAGAHVADFFLSSLTNAKTLVDSRMKKFQALMPTSPGGVG